MQSTLVLGWGRRCAWEFGHLPRPLALDPRAPAPGLHIWAPKELLCSAQHCGSFLRAPPGGLGQGGPGASLLPLECNKGSHCVPCSPSSGVVVGVWSQGPLAPGGLSEGALQPWVHRSHKSRLWLLDGHSVSASVATATRSLLLVLRGRWLVPLHRAAENLGLWNLSFISERNTKEGTQEGRAEPEALGKCPVSLAISTALGTASLCLSATHWPFPASHTAEAS